MLHGHHDRLLFLLRPPALVLMLSPTLRQSTELFRKALAIFDGLGQPVLSINRTTTTLELANGSRLVALPENEEGVRSFSGVRLLVIDEAARVCDPLYRAVRPMLSVSRGRLVALSTPFGQRGWFYQEWQRDSAFKKVRITWKDCPRIAFPEAQVERAGGDG